MLQYLKLNLQIKFKKSMEALHVPGQPLHYFFSSRNDFIKFHNLLIELSKIIQFTSESNVLMIKEFTNISNDFFYMKSNSH